MVDEGISLPEKEVDLLNDFVLQRVEQSSVLIEPKRVKPLDIVVTRSSETQKYSHVAVILKAWDGLVVAHSVIGQVPTGVHVSPLKIINNFPVFDFKPNLTEDWERLYLNGLLEFRRLNILKKNEKEKTSI